LINLIKKSKFGDTVPVATKTLHAKRAPSTGVGFIDENGGVAPSFWIPTKTGELQNT
jgi:hypothetical protein